MKKVAIMLFCSMASIAIGALVGIKVNDTLEVIGEMSMEW